MKTPSDRLREARIAAGYETAAKAARAMGVKAPTYHGHENGHGGKITREPFERYAKFFRVDLDWLLTGKGDMRTGAPSRIIRVHGYVVGGEVEEYPASALLAQRDFIEIQQDGEIGALEVQNDSMWPRFLPGEYILYELQASPPRDLVNQYAIVQTLDGRRMIKILRHGRDEGRWRLDSHNGPSIEDIELLAAWRYCGVVPPTTLVVPPESPRRKRGGGAAGSGGGDR